jgi:tetratricopeptide (TPR) repeat protein
LLAVLVVTLTQPVWATDPVDLAIGLTRSASQAADERHTYRFAAREGGSYLIEVAQSGLDLVVSVEGPDSEIITVNSPLKRDEREFVLLENAQAGAHEVAVYSQEYTGAIGEHTIQVLEFGDQAEPRTLEAWRLMTEAGVAYHRANREGWQEAVSSYEAARTIWRDLGRTREEAQALFSIASIEYWQLYNWSGSAELAAQVAAIYAGIDEPALAANALQLQAAALIEHANEVEQSPAAGVSPEAQSFFDQALALFGAALATHERLGNVYDVAQITNNIGLTYYYLGEYDRARNYWQQAAVQFENTDEWAGETLALMNQGVVDMEAGYLTNAIQTHERIVELLEPGKMDGIRAMTLDNLAYSYRLFGRLDDALKAHAAALEMHEVADDLEGKANSLLGIGKTYFAFGEFVLATDYLQQSLILARQVNDARSEESIFRYRGNIAYLTGDYASALDDHETALEIATSLPDRAELQILIARDLRALGRSAEAVQATGEARAMAEHAASERLMADALNELGHAQLGHGEPVAALKSLRDSLDIYDALDIRSKKSEALQGLAQVAWVQGELAEAARYGEASLAHVESIRGRVGDPELRAFYSARNRRYYDIQVDILMALHARLGDETTTHLRAALSVAERAKARLTFDLLHQARVDRQREVDSGMAAKEAALYERLVERRHQRDLMLNASFSSQNARDMLPEVRADMAAIETALNLVEDEIRSTSPEAARPAASKTLNAIQIQALLDAETALLQYSLGEQRSFVWLVTSSAIQSAELPDRQTIETAARSAYHSLKTYQPDAGARRELEARLAALAAMIFGPIASGLEAKRILVATDGALQYIPFGVLPAPDRPGQRLIEVFEVVGIPSMSVLALKRTWEWSPSPKKTLAMFADPVFEPTDPRLNSRSLLAAASPPTEHSLITRSSVGDDDHLTRLASTGQVTRPVRSRHCSPLTSKWWRMDSMRASIWY